MKEKVLLSWSGGKDSTMALYELVTAGRYEVVALLTTVTEDYDRISMHGVRRILLEEQANALGIPLEPVLISKQSSNDEYERKMREVLERYQGQGISRVAFGDIYLEDLRKYREDNLARIQMQGIFPIWKRDPAELARSFIELGFQAITTCVDSTLLDKRFAGRLFDRAFLAELPVSADPCGENGEFHSFAFAGPLFRKRIEFERGDIVLKDNRFYYCDLVPGDGKVS